MARAIIITGSNGVGKGTIANTLISTNPDLFQRVTRITTRPMRNGEVNGIDYHFIDDESFRYMVEQGLMSEWSQFNHGYYGTRTQDIVTIAETGREPVLDLDVPAAFSVYQNLREIGNNAIPFLVSPISKEAMQSEYLPEMVAEEVRRRIIGRSGGFDTKPEVLTHRMEVAREIYTQLRNYPYIIENTEGNLDVAIQQIYQFRENTEISQETRIETFVESYLPRA